MLFQIANENVLTQFISKAKMRSDAWISYLIYSLLGYNRQKMSTRKSFSGHSFCKKKFVDEMKFYLFGVNC